MIGEPISGNMRRLQLGAQDDVVVQRDQNKVDTQFAHRISHKANVSLDTPCNESGNEVANLDAALIRHARDITVGSNF